MRADGYLTGRPVSLTVLDFGRFRVDADGRVIGIAGFLIRSDAGEAVLVDSGFPAKYAEDAAAAGAEDRLGGFGEVVALSRGNLVEAQLATAGTTPGEIDLVVQTHTHIDHIGGLAAFPRAPMVIAAAERALPRPLYWGEAQPWDWPEREYLTVAGDTALGPALDLLAAPGHAPGQLALFLELPGTGPVLLTSDAVSRPAEVAEGFADAPDPAAARASAARLMALAGERDAFVIYGHDPAQWPLLRKAPAAYT